MSDAPTGLADAPVAGAAPAARDPARELNALSTQLREKDQLVAALTERLEQAAEQLDRLRRTGVDKGRRPIVTSAGGSAPDWLYEHKPTFDDLKRVLSNWNEIQPGVTFGRIEAQLADLRDLLAAGAAPPPLPPPLRESTSSERPAAVKAPPPAPKPAAKSSGNDWWEAQKAALLGNAPPAEEAATAGSAAQAPQASTDSSPADLSGEMAGSRTSLADFKIPDALPPLDFETLTLDEAKQAIRVRDAVIEQLREPLLLAQMAGELPHDLHSIDQLPGPVRQRLADIETHWQAKFRQIELDLSLERARLGREQAQLKHQQDLLQKQLKHLGHAPGAADADESDDSKSRRRWFRFMGKPGDEAKPDGE